MPLYEYECDKCGTRYEMLRRMDDRDVLTKCPQCGNSTVSRICAVPTVAPLPFMSGPT